MQAEWNVACGSPRPLPCPVPLLLSYSCQRARFHKQRLNGQGNSSSFLGTHHVSMPPMTKWLLRKGGAVETHSLAKSLSNTSLCCLCRTAKAGSTQAGSKVWTPAWMGARVQGRSLGYQHIRQSGVGAARLLRLLQWICFLFSVAAWKNKERRINLCQS